MSSNNNEEAPSTEANTIQNGSKKDATGNTQNQGGTGHGGNGPGTMDSSKIFSKGKNTLNDAEELKGKQPG